MYVTFETHPKITYKTHYILQNTHNNICNTHTHTPVVTSRAKSLQQGKVISNTDVYLRGSSQLIIMKPLKKRKISVVEDLSYL